MQGLLPINKPAGITSYDVIRRVKRVLKTLPNKVKIGHAGTLDPFASGVLILMLGKATKRFDEIQGWKKTYLATAKLGSSSDTLDRTGEITAQAPKEVRELTKMQIQKVADKYIGEIEQEIPAYAAAKYKGRKLYEYARDGVKIPQKSKKVVIHSIEVLSTKDETVEMRVVCGSGTYIRQLSYDIMKELGIESYLDTLVRESVGEIGLDDCTITEQVTDADSLAKQLLLALDE